jgi:hypothetical protein
MNKNWYKIVFFSTFLTEIEHNCMKNHIFALVFVGYTAMKTIQTN